MKSLNKNFLRAANIVIVQFETFIDKGFHFLPAGPVIEAGTSLPLY